MRSTLYDVVDSYTQFVGHRPSTGVQGRTEWRIKTSRKVRRHCWRTVAVEFQRSRKHGYKAATMRTVTLEVRVELEMNVVVAIGHKRYETRKQSFRGCYTCLFFTTQQPGVEKHRAGSACCSVQRLQALYRDKNIAGQEHRWALYRVTRKCRDRSRKPPQ